MRTPGARRLCARSFRLDVPKSTRAAGAQPLHTPLRSYPNQHTASSASDHAMAVLAKPGSRRTAPPRARWRRRPAPRANARRSPSSPTAPPDPPAWPHGAAAAGRAAPRSGCMGQVARRRRSPAPPRHIERPRLERLRHRLLAPEPLPGQRRHQLGVTRRGSVVHLAPRPPRAGPSPARCLTCGRGCGRYDGCAG